MTESLNHTAESLNEEMIKARNLLFDWATTETFVGNSKLDAKAFTEAIRDKGDLLTQRLVALTSLENYDKAERYQNARDRQHLAEHSEGHNEQGEPMAQWELELMGLRRVNEIQYEVVCNTCSSSTEAEQYFGKKLEWDDLQGNTITQMSMNAAIDARDSHIDSNPDHRVTLEIV